MLRRSCRIDTGFGLHTFKEELTGPEYAARYIAQVEEMGIPCMPDTIVVDIQAGEPFLIYQKYRLPACLRNFSDILPQFPGQYFHCLHEDGGDFVIEEATVSSGV